MNRLGVCFVLLATTANSIAQETSLRVEPRSISSAELREKLQTLDLVPIDEAELDRRIRFARANASAAQPCPRKASYELQLDQTGQLAGDFSLELPAFDTSTNTLLALGKPAFEQLSFATTAKWGISPSRNVLLFAKDETKASGTCALRGSKRGFGHEFQFRGFDSTSSQLFLTLPRTVQLQTNGTLVNQRIADDPKFRRWEVIPLPLRPTTLTLINGQPNAVRPPVADVRVTWSLRPDSTTFQAEFLVQTEEPIMAFSVPVPQDTVIESVSYGDSETLPIDIVGAADQRVLNVQLPRPLNGNSRSFVLAARARAVDGPWHLPSFRVASCSRLDGSSVETSTRELIQRVRINSPLELQQFDLSGYSQTNSDFDLDGTHTLTLTRLFEDATAVLQLGQPTREVRLSVLNRLSPLENSWNYTTFVTTPSQLPSVIRLKLPENYVVLRVGTGSDGATPCQFLVEKQVDGEFLSITVPPTDSTTLRVEGSSTTTPKDVLKPVRTPAVSIVSLPSDRLRQDEEQLELTAAQASSDLGLSDGSLFTPDYTHIRSLDAVAILEPEPSVPERVVEATESVSGEPVANLQLTSNIGHNASRHIAIFETSEANLFAFTLPDACRVTGIKVNGQPGRYKQTDGTVTIPTSGEQQSQIEVRYELQLQNDELLHVEHEIPVPQAQTMGRFSWQLTFSPNTTLVRLEPFNTAPLENQTVWHSLLGPLLQTEVPTSAMEPISLATPPRQLRVTVRKTSMARKLAWIALGLTLIAGMLLRKLASEISLAVISSGLAATCLLTGHPLSQICGGAFLGMLTAFLLGDPRNISLRQPILRKRTVRQTLRLSVLGALALWCGHTAAQEPQTETAGRVFRIADSDQLFVERSLLSKLEQADIRPFPIALSKARYAIRFSRTTCAAEVTIDFMRQNEATSLRLPFGEANASECLLDGEPTVFKREGREIVVPLPKQNQDEEISEHKIRFTLHPAVRLEQCSITPARCGDSTVSVVVDDGSEVRLNGRTYNDPESSPPITDQISLAFESDTSLANRTVETRVANACSVTIGATEASVEHELVVTPGEPLEHLDLQIPLAHRFVSLVSTTPSRQRVFRTGNVSHLAIDFLEPLTIAEELTIRLSSPIAPTLAAQDIPLLPLLPGNTDSVVVAPAKDVRIEGLQLTTANGSPEDLQDQFAAQDQSVTLNLDRSAKLDVRVQHVRAFRNVSIDQQVRVTDSQLEHTFVGTFDVRGRVFSHSLTVDKRVLIDTVSVREANVDRLARYQRRGEKLLLLLDGRTSGTQEVTIESRVPRSVGEPTQVPVIQVDDATIRESTLNVEAEPDLEVTLEDQNGAPFSAGPGDTRIDTLATTGEASFRLVEPSRLPVVRTKRRLPPRVESVCFVNSANDGEHPVRWVHRITGYTDTTELQLASGGLQLAESDPIEQIGGQIHTVSLAGEVTILNLSGRVALGNDVPMADWLSPVLHSDAIVVLNDPELIVDGATATDRIAPDWAGPADTDNRRFLAPQSGSLQLVAAPPSTEGSPVTLVQELTTELWVKRQTTGITTLRTTGLGNLRLDLPENIQVESLQVNERRQTFSREGPEAIIVQLAQPDSTVALRWSHPSAATVKFPLPADIPEDARWYVHREQTNVTVIGNDLVEVRDGVEPDEANRETSVRMLTFAPADPTSETAAPFITVKPATSSLPGLTSRAMFAATIAFGCCLFALLLSPGARIGTGFAVVGAVLVTVGSPIVGAAAIIAGTATWLFVPRPA